MGSIAPLLHIKRSVGVALLVAAVCAVVAGTISLQEADEIRAQVPPIKQIVASPAKIDVSGGDTVNLNLKVFGQQDKENRTLADGKVTWKHGDQELETEADASYTYEAPSSPGTQTITAEIPVDLNCDPEREGSICSATFTIRVKRPAATQAADASAQNPTGEIPAVLTDSDGNQYEVFTPEEGGTFSGEGYSVSADVSVIPNGEILGVRMAMGGEASNVGETSDRHTLAGNQYEIHAVDSSGAAASGYVLEDHGVNACVPLPDSLRGNIDKINLVSLNSDGSMTAYSSNVAIRGSSTHVCGQVSELPATVAAAIAESPAPLATPEPPPLPDTGGISPTSSSTILLLMLLGLAVVTTGAFVLRGLKRSTIG